MIKTIQLIRNIGSFDSISPGAAMPLDAVTLFYAENGRGKTTLSEILRSLSTGSPTPITERSRLGATHPPHVIIVLDDGTQYQFQAGAWSGSEPNVLVFNDHYVAENVCSGIEVTFGHRQNLHELIIGAQGVALNNQVQQHVVRIEQHNRDLRTLASRIPESLRGRLSIEDYCALEALEDIDVKIDEADKLLKAAKASAEITSRDQFSPIRLPKVNIDHITEILQKNLAGVEQDAMERVKDHIDHLGHGSERWISTGMSYLDSVSDTGELSENTCPFCTQSLADIDIISHYRSYFSESYRQHTSNIKQEVESFDHEHRSEIQAAFERDVRSWSEAIQFWGQFLDMPKLEIDSAAVTRAWREAYDAVKSDLGAKSTSPLEGLELGDDVITKIEAYNVLVDTVHRESSSLISTNAAIEIIKEKAPASNIQSLDRDLNDLHVNKSRFSPSNIQACSEYINELQAKQATEAQRDAARTSLDLYRNQIFPTYEQSINQYLQSFNAGFRLQSVSPANVRSGSTCNYNVLINNVPVAIASQNPGQPSFKTTLSSGDRNTLALAFFFAQLDNDPNLADKIVVIDDPMTSLDEHRALTTIQEVRRLQQRVGQVILLSHSKAFLGKFWNGLTTRNCATYRIARSNQGSEIENWNVSQDVITEHDRRHDLVSRYVQNSVGIDLMSVAVALRPMLEVFIRVSYPGSFKPGDLLGPFIGLCEQREGTANEILSRDNRIELRNLLDYANLFHHDTNPAFQTVTISDLELKQFSERTLTFIKK